MSMLKSLSCVAGIVLLLAANAAIARADSSSCYCPKLLRQRQVHYSESNPEVRFREALRLLEKDEDSPEGVDEKYQEFLDGLSDLPSSPEPGNEWVERWVEMDVTDPDANLVLEFMLDSVANGVEVDSSYLSIIGLDVFRDYRASSLYLELIRLQHGNDQLGGPPPLANSHVFEYYESLFRESNDELLNELLEEFEDRVAVDSADEMPLEEIVTIHLLLELGLHHGLAVEMYPLVLESSVTRFVIGGMHHLHFMRSECLDDIMPYVLSVFETWRHELELNADFRNSAVNVMNRLNSRSDVYDFAVRLVEENPGGFYPSMRTVIRVLMQDDQDQFRQSIHRLAPHLGMLSEVVDYAEDRTLEIHPGFTGYGPQFGN